MKKRLISFVSGVVGLGVVVGAVWAIYAMVLMAWNAFISVPKEIAVALITASTTILVATFTVMVGRYFERRRELDALHREKKIEVYDAFLAKFMSIFHDPAAIGQDELVPFLREFMRKLILWGGPEVISSFVKWKKHLAAGNPDAETIFLTEEFLLAIRSDLRHNNRGIQKGFFAHLFLRNAEIFLLMAQKNKNVTLAELAELAVLEELIESSKVNEAQKGKQVNSV